MCRDLTGEGCGFKPEHAINKKRVVKETSTKRNSEAAETSSDKRRRLNDEHHSDSLNTVSFTFIYPCGIRNIASPPVSICLVS